MVSPAIVEIAINGSKPCVISVSLRGHLVGLVGVEPTMAFAADFVDQSLIR
jgi:hypothetical protein